MIIQYVWFKHKYRRYQKAISFTNEHLIFKFVRNIELYERDLKLILILIIYESDSNISKAVCVELDQFFSLELNSSLLFTTVQLFTV